jgi:hypothetical protein
MTTQKTIPGADFFKSLGRLEALAGKGGTADSKPEDMNKAQLFHTPSNSEKTSWAGGDKSEIGNKWSDSIGEDGTDYHPARKAIAEKTLKGIALSPEEISILKGDLEAAMKDKKEEDDDDDKKKSFLNIGGSEGGKDEKSMGKAAGAMPGVGAGAAGGKMAFKAQKDDDDKPAAEEKDKSMCNKSFNGAVQQSETIQKGLELSEFLTDLVKAFGAGLEGVEGRTTSLMEQAANSILSQLGGYLDARFSEQAQFNKSLAEAIVNIGHGVAGNIEQISQVAQAPAGPPKSQFRAGVQAVEKSFAGPKGEAIDKAQKLDAMVDLVEKGRLNAIEVCKFETTGQLRPDVDSLVVNYIKGGQA